MRTTTLRLGTAVIVLPWHNPVLLAEQAATLDLMSGGRLDFGIGKGYRHSEFKGFRIPPEEAEPRFEEALEVITKRWSSRQRFSHRGRFWQFDDIVVEPPPAQQPHPPLWVAAGSEASIRRAARRGFNLILDQYASPEQLGERIALYRAERAANGTRVRPDADRGRAPALCRQGQGRGGRGAGARRRFTTQRTVDVSRAPGEKTGSHVLSYADGAGGTTEANALLWHARRNRSKARGAAAAGAEYRAVDGGAAAREQLRRFARDIMPAFAAAARHRPRQRTANPLQLEAISQGSVASCQSPHSPETMIFRRLNLRPRRAGRTGAEWEASMAAANGNGGT